MPEPVDPSTLTPGTRIRHKDGDEWTLTERKTGEDAVPLPGWWLHREGEGRHGLADVNWEGGYWSVVVPPVYRLGRRVPAHIFAMVGPEPSDDDIPLLTLPPELVHLGPLIVAAARLPKPQVRHIVRLIDTTFPEEPA